MTSNWACDKAVEYLGYCGQMMSGSKKASVERRVVWNGNVCTREHGKLWFGDISITESSKALQKLADALRVNVYVLRERDARFEFETSPLFENAVEMFKSSP